MQWLSSGCGVCIFSSNGPLAVFAAVDAVVFAVRRRIHHSHRHLCRRRRIAEVAAVHLANDVVGAVFFPLPPMSRWHLQVTSPVVGAQVV